MTQEQRRTICLYRLERADETLDEAKALYRINRLKGTMNRIYYALFYAVGALAHANGFNASKHANLVGWFNKTYIHTGIVSVESGRIFRKAFDMRSRGDYTDLIQMDLDTITEFLESAEPFLAIIRRLTLERLDEIR